MLLLVVVIVARANIKKTLSIELRICKCDVNYREFVSEILTSKSKS